MSAGTESLPVFPLALTAVALSFLTIAVTSTTSFAKISVVLSVLRNALGLQQSPPNSVLYGMALLLTSYIMAPTIDKGYSALERRNFQLSNFEDYQGVFLEIRDSVSEFLVRNSDPVQRSLLTDSARKLWPKNAAAKVSDSDFLIVVPAFMISEMTQAFKIGFLLYIPFLAIDLAVTCIILAMGISQVQPTVIATPLKLLLFVAVDGWSRVIRGLILTYA